MTFWESQNRTPHDSIENAVSIAYLVICIPCLCVVAFGKTLRPRRGKTPEVKDSQPTAKANTANSSFTLKSRISGDESLQRRPEIEVR